MEQLWFWTNISVIWLSFLCFVGAIIPLAAAYFAVRGMNVVLRETRPILRVGQSYSSKMRAQVDNASTTVVRPVVAIKRKARQVTTSVQQLASGKR